MNKKLFISLQYLVPQQLLSRLMGMAADCSWPWLKNYMISRFIGRYQVDLNLTLSDRLEDYPTFNSFFTRALKASVRPISPEADAIVSPIDGCISQIGRLKENSLLQAKGAYFTVDALLGKENAASSPHFYNGHFVTFYLSPKDYHRVHLPLDGTLIQTTYVPGKLFSVNPTAVEAIPQLFSRNERLICLFETAIGQVAVILIGAMMVGKIQTIWGLNERSRHIVQRSYPGDLRLSKGAELGRFNMGSSVILLFEKDRLQWLPGLQERSAVQMGQLIGTSR